MKNIADDPRSFTGNKPHTFFVVHLILSVVSIGFGTTIGWLGWKGYRATAPESDRAFDDLPCSKQHTKSV